MSITRQAGRPASASSIFKAAVEAQRLHRRQLQPQRLLQRQRLGPLLPRGRGPRRSLDRRPKDVGLKG